MNGNFKKCARGHFYSSQLSTCPYCPTDGATGDLTGVESHNNAMGETQTTNNIEDINKTQIFGSTSTGTDIGTDTGTKPLSVDTDTSGVEAPTSNHTLFIDETESEDGRKKVEIRTRRKLVGWLVSYTLDEMGIDFKLYEGRNIIGRKIDCQITITDPTVSTQHAVILFRNGKFSISDMQSSSGTFVNDEDIELEARYIGDGDTIRIGRTILKFRSAL